ncbi:polysaccharide deacetylase family protein [Spirulina sp. 06S082]|uniref:polysaccharide deacetylase family protein n=1 Tax=Spirulina sp. 06S082 TaxID=3110248 RepID=UPI002B20A5CB|nr:polysaccharide deacetylase family protein [Spirulina sp. 06S082]MEA5467779.1 polysaccharide deacetylase family protein [Spirulina sp. 06S082]
MKNFKKIGLSKTYFGLAIAIALSLAIAKIIIDSMSFKIPIFGFHSIFDRTNPEKLPSRASYLDYPVQDLEQVLKYLIQEEYWFLSSQDLYDYFLTKTKTIPQKYVGKRPVMLTFDDGYENIHAFVLPLLEKLAKQYNIRIPIVLFLNPAFMEREKPDRKDKYLNCDRVKDGFKKGFYDVQSAGVNHTHLTKLEISELEKELLESQRKLQECIAEPTLNPTVSLHFAYPYNRINRRVKFYTSKYYQSGYLYNDEIYKLNFWQNHYKISRLAVFRNDSPQKLIDRARQASKITAQ